MRSRGDDWTIAWRGDPKAPVPDEAIEWLRSRPECVQAVMLRFPPNCIVRANRQLVTPGPMHYPPCVGYVASYFEDGTVSVVQPGNPVRGQCQTAWLEVIGYCGPFTSDLVTRVLGGVGGVGAWA